MLPAATSTVTASARQKDLRTTGAETTVKAVLAGRKYGKKRRSA
jgi:hypothetical protein